MKMVVFINMRNKTTMVLGKVTIFMAFENTKGLLSKENSELRHKLHVFSLFPWAYMYLYTCAYMRGYYQVTKLNHQL